MRAQRDLTAFGYSSDSESDDPNRPPPPPSTCGDCNKKKQSRRPKPPPQQTINRIWKRFASKKSSKALAILPFDPVALPSTPERNNEPLNAGYERAAEECRRKVQKIIQECRRVNMRYRDRGWDLDWDTKFSHGYTLNYLGSKKYDISYTHASTSASVPKAVKRVHEIFEKPAFMKNVDGGDVKQGYLGDCWLIAGLTGLANVPDGIKRICVEYDTKIGIYGFVFYRDGEWIYSIIDDKLFLTSPCWDSPSLQREMLQQADREDAEREYRKTYQTGSKALFFGQCKDQNETWVPLIEKAYAKAHGDYASLAGGWIGEALEDLSGGVTSELLTSDILDTDGFWENELSRVNQEFMFGCSTGLLDGGYGDRDGIREGHAYVVVDARTLKSGQRLVKLRNPWGKNRKGIWEGPWSDGSKEWTNEVKEELGHTFGNDSVFWISYEDMLRKYQHIDRTRLFRDPGWLCSQRWIGVEVPWKAQYNEKFVIKLTKKSPLVLTLSQLDNRYYKGLHGQYSFRLHFRLHEQIHPDTEDYILRSHGNYLMDRSVSVELPSMPPGTYSIFISVVAERDTELPSVEDVVKRELKKRAENVKLAQVGQAYDLAHSKGVAHLEQVAKLRKQSQQQKATNSRMKERRRLWEKRHINRDIQKKQKEKNQQKNTERREKANAEQKKKEEAEEAEKKKKEEAAAAEKRKNEEFKPKDKAVQTEKSSAGDDKSVQTDTPQDSAANGSVASSESSGSPQDTPKSESAQSADETPKASEGKVPVHPVSGGPPPPALAQARKEETTQPSQQGQNHAQCSRLYSSDSDSSDSPVEDWEAMYSDDDMVRKPRLNGPPPSKLDNYYDSEDESTPDPWNAICIVGMRVYSKDEDLKLHVVMEGGLLAEGGMGDKGAPDLDDAQANAGGVREKATDTEGPVVKREIINGKVVIVETEDESETKKEVSSRKKDKKTREKSSESEVNTSSIPSIYAEETDCAEDYATAFESDTPEHTEVMPTPISIMEISPLDAVESTPDA